MRVLIINQHPKDWLGGSEIQCDIIAKNLKEFGHEVFYGAINPGSAQYDATYMVLPIKRPMSFNLLRQWRLIDPEVIYWRANQKGLLGAVLLAKLLNIKFVYGLSTIEDARGYQYLKSRRFTKNWLNILATPFKFLLILIKNLILKISIKLVDGVSSLNKDFLNFLPASLPNKIYHPNSMELAWGPEFEWPKKYVVWVGNIRSSKNPELYLRLAVS